jgi:mono/diheme cytochrome c family protein
VKRTLVVVALGLALTGCGLVRGCTSSKPPIHINPSMDDQPKVRPQSESAFFYDGAGMRKPVEGTVARGELREDDAFFKGIGADGKPLAAIPVTVDAAMLARGADRYAIYCAPCHDLRGDGKGILFQRGNVPTTSFHADKVLAYPPGQVFDIMTNGSGLMPAYKWPIPPADRWAIVAHIQSLQKERAETLARRAAP